VREIRVQRGARLGHGEGAAWCQVTARSIADGEFVLVIADIDTIKQREANALHEAQHDELTGLPNRRLLAERAAAALATSELRKVSCAVLAIDLDGFKEVNDRYGHEVGDAMLREIAARLTRVMRPQDTVARRGGDEFAVLVPDVGSVTEVERIATRLLQAVEQPLVPTQGDRRSPCRPASALRWRRSRAATSNACCSSRSGDVRRQLKGKNRFAFAQGAGLPANVTPLVPRVSRTSEPLQPPRDGLAAGIVAPGDMQCGVAALLVGGLDDQFAARKFIAHAVRGTNPQPSPARCAAILASRLGTVSTSARPSRPAARGASRCEVSPTTICGAGATRSPAEVTECRPADDEARPRTRR